MWTGRKHCCAGLHHDAVICTLCHNYPNLETVRKAKGRWQGEGYYKHCKTVLGLGTHHRHSHKIRLNFSHWVEARDVLALQWNDEVFVRFERCSRCGILISEYFDEHVRSCSCSHLTGFFQTSFESVCKVQLSPVSVNDGMNINGIQFAIDMVPIWMEKLIEFVGQFPDFIVDKKYEFADLE